MSLLRSATLGGPERNGRRRQGRGHAQEGQGRRDNRLYREGGRGLGADGSEVREDGRPLSGDAAGEVAGERASCALRGEAHRGTAVFLWLRLVNCPDYLWLRLPDANIRTALARVSALGEQGPGRIPDAPGQRQLQPNFFYVVHSAAKHLCDHVWGLPGLLCQENPHRWTPRGIERSRSSGWPWSLPTRRRAACMMV